MNLRELIDFFLHNGIDCDEEDWKCLNDVLGDIENLENVSSCLECVSRVCAIGCSKKKTI
jgi:hypothetical protein